MILGKKPIFLAEGVLLKPGIFLAALAACSLVACGGGGGSTGGGLPPAGNHPTTYSVQLHWEPAPAVGLAAILRPEATRRVLDTSSTGAVVVASGNGGSSAYDDTNGIPAYVTVSVSPQPSPGAQVAITSTSSDVEVDPTPTPAQPEPTASPAALLAATTTNTSQSGQTVSASYDGATDTQSLVIVQTLQLVAPSTGSPALPDAVGFTFDSNCNAVPQSMTAGSDVYITYGDNAVIGFPGGGTAFQHGYDVTTLTAADWANNETSIGVNTMANSMFDTIVFKTASGRIVYLHATAFGGAGSSSAATTFQGEYGCLS